MRISWPASSHSAPTKESDMHWGVEGLSFSRYPGCWGRWCSSPGGAKRGGDAYEDEDFMASLKSLGAY
jgi:hypothetical protein